MRHRKKKATLGRESAQRKALMRSLADSLVLHGSIKTTLAKAKALRGVIEPLITNTREGDLTAVRKAKRFLYTDKAIKKLVEEIAPQYKNRNGGYTRVTKLGTRKNDAAEMGRIEFV